MIISLTPPSSSQSSSACLALTGEAHGVYVSSKLEKIFHLSRFYLGYPAIGLLKFSTLGFFFIGHLVSILILEMMIIIMMMMIG